MLIIRNRQKKILNQERQKEFVNKAITHLENVLPDRCRELGKQKVEASVLMALEKAGQYGFKSEVEILRYLNIMYVLDFGFDENPKYAWALEILEDHQFDPNVKIELLCTKVLEELRAQ